MRSRTSYFNATLFCKTVTRFWPLWFFYLAVWFVSMPLVLYSNLNWGGTVRAMQSSICQNASTFGIIFSLISACVAAMAVWSFMYSARSTSAMACLPVKREGVFLSISLGGIAPLLAVNALIFLLSLGVQAIFGVVDVSLLAQWFCAVSLELVFYYGFALLCAQLTGNLAVLPVLYLVLNFTAYVLERVISSVLSDFVYGASGGVYSEVVLALSPVLYMGTHFNTQSVRAYTVNEYYEVVGYYLEGWGTLIAYAAVGLALAALALWLYRRRRMESAGDVVAVNILKPVFKYCMTFGCAVCIGTMLYELTFDGGYAISSLLFGMTYGGKPLGQWPALVLLIILMFIGAFIGYFASEMLIHKSFRVWRGRWTGLGVSALVIAALLLSVELDLFGYERNIPNPSNVESVYVSTSSYYYYGRTSDGGATLCEPENIAAAVQLHRGVVERKNWYENFEWRPANWRSMTLSEEEAGSARSMYLSIDYVLKNGRHVTRNYRNLAYLLNDPSTQTDALALQTLLNTPEAVLSRKVPEGFDADMIFNAYVTARILPGDIEKAKETTRGVYNSYGDPINIDSGYIDMVEYSGYDVIIGAEGLEAGAPIEYGDPKYTDDYISATWNFTLEEAAELYNECILPDMADGTIGTIWIVEDENYKNTVYSVTISLEMRKPSSPTLAAGSGYQYNYFYTVPTVNSVRTNRWLTEHGVILRTIAEAGEL